MEIVDGTFLKVEGYVSLDPEWNQLLQGQVLKVTLSGVAYMPRMGRTLLSGNIATEVID